MIASLIGHVMEYDLETGSMTWLYLDCSLANKTLQNKHSPMRLLLYRSGAGVRGWIPSCQSKMPHGSKHVCRRA